MQGLAEKTAMKIAKVSDHIGAEVTGIDLRRPVDEATRRRLNEAVVEHVALVIRGQQFTPEEYLAAVGLFGQPMAQHHDQFSVPGLPLVNVVSNRNTDKNGKRVYHGEGWHTDHTNHVRPPKYTSLYAVAVPEDGGHTNVANMRAGYAVLPDAIKRRIAGLKTANVFQGSAARHNADYAVERQAAVQPSAVLQPLVRTNPENGTPSLYFHPNKTEHIVGMGPEESQELLGDLLDRALRPEFIYSHKWRVGDMLIWDNRSAMHKASFDYGDDQHRRLYRVIVEGELPY